MTEYLIELFNMFTAFAIGFPLFLYPMWKTRNVKSGFVYAYIVCFAILVSVALFIVRQFITIDLNTIQGFKLCFLVPQFILPFIAFRKKVWQAVFLITLTSMYYLIFTGIGNSVTEMWFPENPLFYSALISNAVIAVTFPPLVLMLGRLYGNSDAEQATAFWRLAWLIPASFHIVILVPGSYVTGSDFGSWFIIIRVLAYAISLFICVLFDVVTRQISEAETAKHEAEAVKREAAMLERMNRQKTELMSSISHEARTPLSVLASYAGLVSMELKHKGLEPQTIANLGKIEVEAKRVAELIDSMNKLALRGDFTAKRISFDIGDVIRQMTGLYRHLLESGNTELEIHIAGDLPAVFGSPEELTQVLFNLLQNARKHTEGGTISIFAEPSEGHIVVSVSDTGTGISPELLPRVFERGVSGTGGTGLGLAICKEIIESHGGEIRVESGELRVESGTVVTFALPIYKADFDLEDTNGK